jgi:hypothetical protein
MRHQQSKAVRPGSAGGLRDRERLGCDEKRAGENDGERKKAHSVLAATSRAAVDAARRGRCRCAAHDGRSWPGRARAVHRGEEADRRGRGTHNIAARSGETAHEAANRRSTTRAVLTG